jgi:hypothetical protein
MERWLAGIVEDVTDVIAEPLIVSRRRVSTQRHGTHVHRVVLPA